MSLKTNWLLNLLITHMSFFLPIPWLRFSYLRNKPEIKWQRNRKSKKQDGYFPVFRRILMLPLKKGKEEDIRWSKTFEAG